MRSLRVDSKKGIDGETMGLNYGTVEKQIFFLENYFST